jgi:tetratricopeptide (TPR) repeat protein
VTSSEQRASRPVFISYATADRRQALSVCEALEGRGVICWISCRDVEPGENYQEAIVRAIRQAPAMVLVFSDAANNSDEIKKELSLASRYDVPVLALRIEDVEPSDAFAYELSTRQWIDAFEGWDKSVDALVRRLGQISLGTSTEPAAALPAGRRRGSAPVRSRRALAIAAVLLLVLVGGGMAAWFLVRPSAAAAHTMQVRLTGFQRLSPDLPAGLPDAMRDEIIAAFNDDGVIGVSTASAPPAGVAPAYTLGGTIRRDGDKIRVIARLANERSAATLWSNSFVYDANRVDRVPRRIAVDAGNLVRCGLFGASTYQKTLPDAVFAAYLQYCHNIGLIEFEPTKALDFAHKVVAAAPEFSWGWSAVEKAAYSITESRSSAETVPFRKEALEAAATAIRLDPLNSEALQVKSMLLDAGDLIGREALLQRAIKARPLTCGCEHHTYGGMLQEVGRDADAIGEYRRSTDVLALMAASQAELGVALAVASKPEQAKEHLDAAVDLSSDSALQSLIALYLGPIDRDHYPAALEAINDPNMHAPAVLKSAVAQAYAALTSGNARAKAAAADALASLPPDMQGATTVRLFGALGANSQALKGIEALHDRVETRSWLFLPWMAGARADPAFPAVAERLGLMKYWRATRTRPDVCAARKAPPFCRMI